MTALGIIHKPASVICTSNDLAVVGLDDFICVPLLQLRELTSTAGSCLCQDELEATSEMVR